MGGSYALVGAGLGGLVGGLAAYSLMASWWMSGYGRMADGRKSGCVMRDA